MVLTVIRYTTKKFSREGINVLTRRVVERVEPVGDVEFNVHLLIKFAGKNDRKGNGEWFVKYSSNRRYVYHSWTSNE